MIPGLRRVTPPVTWRKVRLSPSTPPCASRHSLCGTAPSLSYHHQLLHLFVAFIPHSPLFSLYRRPPTPLPALLWRAYLAHPREAHRANRQGRTFEGASSNSDDEVSMSSPVLSSSRRSPWTLHSRHSPRFDPLRGIAEGRKRGRAERVHTHTRWNNVVLSKRRVGVALADRRRSKSNARARAHRAASDGQRQRRRRREAEATRCDVT